MIALRSILILTLSVYGALATTSIQGACEIVEVPPQQTVEASSSQAVTTGSMGNGGDIEMQLATNDAALLPSGW